MKQRMVVVGGVAAGMSAASRAKRVNPDLEVTVLEKDNYISFAAASLPYYVAGHFDDYRTLIARTPEEAARQGVDVRLGHQVNAIDPQAGTVTAWVKGSGEQVFPYDVLVLGTGAAPFVPTAWQAHAIEGVFTLRTIDDAQTLKDRLQSPGAGAAFNNGRSVGGRPRVAILGGGYIGIDVADIMLELGCPLTLIDIAPQVLTNFDADIAQHVEQDLRDAGVDVRLGDGVTALESADGRLTGVRLASGDLVSADVAIVALGVRPRVQFAQDAGVEIGETGAIAVDSQQRTNIPNIFAAGDCSEALHLVTGRPTYIPLGTTANKQGRVAGTVIGGGEASFPGIVGTAVLKSHKISVARSGLTEKQALDLGYDAAAVTITAEDRVDSYPGVQEILVKFVGEKGSGRLLGAQIVGAEPLSVSGRIDTVAAALYNRMNVEDIGHMDLCYAPAFAPVWDPLLIAANVLQRRL